MAKIASFLGDSGLAAVAFVSGCIVWNYFSPTIKSWLHLKESALGAWIKSKIGSSTPAA